jgi:hypothetical protein
MATGTDASSSPPLLLKGTIVVAEVEGEAGTVAAAEVEEEEEDDEEEEAIEEDAEEAMEEVDEAAPAGSEDEESGGGGEEEDAIGEAEEAVSTEAIERPRRVDVVVLLLWLAVISPPRAWGGRTRLFTTVTVSFTLTSPPSSPTVSSPRGWEMTRLSRCNPESTGCFVHFCMETSLEKLRLLFNAAKLGMFLLFPKKEHKSEKEEKEEPGGMNRDSSRQGSTPGRLRKAKKSCPRVRFRDRKTTNLSSFFFHSSSEWFFSPAHVKSCSSSSKSSKHKCPMFAVTALMACTGIDSELEEFLRDSKIHRSFVMSKSSSFSPTVRVKMYCAASCR